MGQRVHSGRLRHILHFFSTAFILGGIVYRYLRGSAVRCVVCSTFRRSCICSFHAWWHHSCTMFCDARVCPVFVCHTAGDSLVFRSVYQLGNHSKLTPECQPRFSSFSVKKCPLSIRVQTVELMSKTCPRHLRKGLVALIVPNFDGRSQLAAASL